MVAATDALLATMPLFRPEIRAGLGNELQVVTEWSRETESALVELFEITGFPCFAFNPQSSELAYYRLWPQWLRLQVQPVRLTGPSDERITSVTRGGICCASASISDALDVPHRFGIIARVSNEPVPAEWVMAATEAGISARDFQQWTDSIPVCESAVLERMLAHAQAVFRHKATEGRLRNEVYSLTRQMDNTFEEISLLHSLTQRLHLSHSPKELAEYCLSRLGTLIPATNAIWIEGNGEDDVFLVDGDVELDEVRLARLTARFERRDWNRPLVKNGVDRSLLGADFAGLKNFTLVPVGEAPFHRGWIISCNLREGREFGSVEASLLASIGAIIGTHIQNIELYRDHQNLVLGFVGSLVQTLDAKDPYTRGHSERVALVARRIGLEMKLPEEDLDDIYLSGLLHDLGKIGVDDRILRKDGSLTPEEFGEIHKHPMIGFQILRQLKNLQHVLPGVRSHHESFNGRGYPDGLVGEAIPLMARIIAVADSYDAMGSDRPYRKGMPLERLEEIFRRGSGAQWDPRVIDAYFACRDDVLALCRDHKPSGGNLLDDFRGEAVSLRRFLR